MAEATKKNAVKKTAEKKPAEKKPVEKKAPGAGNTETAAEKKRPYKVKKNLDPATIVPVRNGFQGKLVYRSRRTGEEWIWNEFGDEQDIELSELKNAKNTYKRFFTDNWFMIDDPEIIEYLGVEQYYRNALTVDGFDELFEETPDVIADRVAKLSGGQKRSVIYRAKQLIAEGGIDSLSVISALERSLGVELIER